MPLIVTVFYKYGVVFRHDEVDENDMLRNVFMEG